MRGENFSYSYPGLAKGNDLAGNRIAQSRAGVSEGHMIALSSNRLLSVSGGVAPRSISYDSAGNAANDNRGPGANYAYAYSAAGDLSTLTRDGPLWLSQRSGAGRVAPAARAKVEAGSPAHGIGRR